MWSIRTIIAFAWFSSSLAVTGCSGDADVPMFPEDYAATYQEVRDCRRSADHDLNYIRVLAGPAALGPYQDRDAPFPVGAVVLKEEFADDQCQDLTGFTVMRKEEAGYAPDSGDWSWQKVSADQEVLPHDEQRCTSCHQACNAGTGYDFTCAEP